VNLSVNVFEAAIWVKTMYIIKIVTIVIENWKKKEKKMEIKEILK